MPTLPKLGVGMRPPKAPEEIAAQKAVVVLYLRKRAARLTMARQPENEAAVSRWSEAHNALESVKRVLWNNDWS